MSEHQDVDEAREDDFAKALGAVPSGLFVACCGEGDEATGFLASFVQQVGFEPLCLALAVGQDRPALEKIRRSGAFCVAVLDEASKDLLGHFARGFRPGEPAFEGIATAMAPSGIPYPTDALAWIDCEVIGEVAWSDHVLFCGEVKAGGRREGKPWVHVRKTGRGY